MYENFSSIIKKGVWFLLAFFIYSTHISEIIVNK
jgi:hypothetical protein